MTVESTEVREMAVREQRRWLVTHEAGRIRREWASVRESIDRLAERLDEDPTDEGTALLMVLLPGLMVSGFHRHIAEAAEAISKLAEDEKVGGS